MKINKKQEKNNNGITLIALVITIIVLLILAGVSIAMLTGENGIISQVQNAKNKTNEAAKNEQLDLAKQEDLINETLNGVKVEQVTDTAPGVLEENGTEYTINSIEDLVVFAYDVKSGNTYSGKTVKLGLSLDFNSTKSYVEPFSTSYGTYGYNGELKTLLTSGEGFIPIGVESDEEGTNSFSGTFDGQGNQIINLYINDDRDNGNVGLFAVNYGTIENLGLIQVNITRKDEEGWLTGGVVGQNRADAVISNCFVTGNIKINGIDAVGGITGHNMGNVSDCYNVANIFLENTVDKNTTRVAGIVATNSGTGIIERCYNLGNLELIVTNTLEERAEIISGGIGAVSSGVINECYNLGKINVKTESLGNGKIEIQVGGISGSGKLEIRNSYNRGDIISNCNRGSLYIAGIVGKTSDSSNININNCYNVGNIQGNCEESLDIGGIASILNTNINNCYYLNQDNFTNTETGAGTVKTEDEMKGQSFVDLLNNGNTEVVWKYDVNKNNGYPILSWQ